MCAFSLGSDRHADPVCQDYSVSSSPLPPPLACSTQLLDSWPHPLALPPSRPDRHRWQVWPLHSAQQWEHSDQSRIVSQYWIWIQGVHTQHKDCGGQQNLTLTLSACFQSMLWPSGIYREDLQHFCNYPFLMFNHLAGLSDVSDLQSAVVCKLTLTSHTGVSYWFSGPKKN